MYIKGYNFVMTCPAFPEQYDVYDACGDLIAYVRLRYGHLSASIGGCSMSSVFNIYHHEFADGYKGSFDTDEEREEYLTKIAEAIHLRCQKDKCYRTVDHHVLFEDQGTRPLLVRYATWKDDVEIDEIQSAWEELMQSEEPAEHKVNALFHRFMDRVVDWEVIDYEEVC